MQRGRGKTFCVWGDLIIWIFRKGVNKGGQDKKGQIQIKIRPSEKMGPESLKNECPLLAGSGHSKEVVIC